VNLIDLLLLKSLETGQLENVLRLQIESLHHGIPLQVLRLIFYSGVQGFESLACSRQVILKSHGLLA